MMTAYDVWRGLMYCVGVFVTCNVGGAALRLARDRVSGLMKSRTVMVITECKASRKRHPFDDCAFDEMNRYSEEEPAHVEAEPVPPPPRDGQSFEDMQRQINADTDNADAG